jgi:hypothetical protein
MPQAFTAQTDRQRLAKELSTIYIKLRLMGQTEMGHLYHHEAKAFHDAVLDLASLISYLSQRS